jgi:hypothetical protein
MSQQDDAWDEIYAIGAMLGGAYEVGAIVENYDVPCSPERTRLIKSILALPQFKARR